MCLALDEVGAVTLNHSRETCDVASLQDPNGIMSLGEAHSITLGTYRSEVIVLVY